MEAHLIYDIGDVRAIVDMILKSLDETLIASRISHRRAVNGGDLAPSVQWSRAGLTISHAIILKDVDGVLALVEE
jgi:hypothetical protein